MGDQARPYFKWQYDQFSAFTGRRIGDIGCGLGNFTGFFKDRELYLGFEPDQELAAAFSSIHRADNIRLAGNGDICSREAVAEMKAAHLDTAVCVNVLEHIQDDRAALSNMVEGVVSRGHVIIIVPALPVLFGSLDRLDGHYRRYTKGQLLRLADGLGVSVVKCRYLNMLGAVGWFIKSRVLREKRHGDENYGIMNRLLPFISAAEKMIDPPFGMSLLLVLRKG